MPPTLRLPSKVRVVLEKIADARRGRRLRRSVRTRNFSVISCNCWGAEIYRDLKIPYQTPFVGLYLRSACFVGFLENFEAAIRAPLEFVPESRYLGKVSYPVGLVLGAYEIQFVHYASPEEAREKWNRRRDRLVRERDDCFFMFYEMFDETGRSSPGDMQRFQRLPFRNKVLFAARPLPEVPGVVVVPARDGGAVLEDGPVLYRRCQRYFDLAAWLNRTA
jgi:uncharacterized protein (DUF1919 family)